MYLFSSGASIISIRAQLPSVDCAVIEVTSTFLLPTCDTNQLAPFGRLDVFLNLGHSIIEKPPPSSQPLVILANFKKDKSGKMKVTIVGAGLGGLACGIACRRQGYDVLIVDQVPKFLRLGDSMGFGSNSARLFYRWGVGERMEAISGDM